MWSKKSQRDRHNHFYFSQFCLGLGSALSVINFNVGRVPVDHLTSPGYLLTIVNLIVLVLVIFFFPRETQQEREDKEAKQQKQHKAGEEKKIPVEVLEEPVPKWVSVCCCVLCHVTDIVFYFVLLFVSMLFS